MWELIEQNQKKTITLLILMAILMMAMGYIVGELVAGGAGPFGVFIAWWIWLIQVLISYYFGDSMFLRIAGARELKSGTQHKKLINIVEEMKIASGLDCMPRIYVIDDEAPNAFATGRCPERASIAVTSGLLKLLERDELQGVVGHEIAHINNRDILYLMMTTSMLGTIVFLSDIGSSIMRGGSSSRTSRRDSGGGSAVFIIIALVLIILAPLVAELMYYAISRKREYLADACSALYTRYPDGLASALEKICSRPTKIKDSSKLTAPLYIVHPLKNSLDDATSTHPATRKRVAILRSIGNKVGLANYNQAYAEVTGDTRGLVSNALLAESESFEVAKPAHSDESDQIQSVPKETHLDRVRETTDILWELNGYITIPCSCGTKLKIPPNEGWVKVDCPSCGTLYDVPQKNVA